MKRPRVSPRHWQPERSTSCPLPTSPPWHRSADRSDALLLVRLRRSRNPFCARVNLGGHCSQCLREVVPWLQSERAS
jgi:hypothetical protein